MRTGWILTATGLMVVGVMSPLSAKKALGEFQEKKAAPSYGKDVVPIMKAYCVSCHSATAPAAGLDLSSAKGIQKGKVLVAGKPGESSLVRRMRGLDGLNQMPLGFKPVSEDKIKLVEEWIKAGASFDDGPKMHWAYIPPVAPAVPTIQSKWIRNPIDAFVVEKFLQLGYQPSVVADKETLIRRVSLDLTGLPPTLEEIDAFLADESPDAYEKVVDRLLASPHFGERQARIWLDLARYADTNGYEKDRIRSAWPYRDWVINAFNKNMPYDEFTIEQLAGDMLPNRTMSQWIASGFNRNSMFNEEGGVDQAEARYQVIVDRVSTTSTVFMGSTLQCARCHDHKFDPISQKDFFRVFAVFGNTEVVPVGPKSVSEEKWFEPTIRVTNAEQSRRLQTYITQQEKSQSELNQLAKLNKTQYQSWLESINEPGDFQPFSDIRVDSMNGSTFTVEPDGIVKVAGKNPDQDMYRYTAQLPEGDLSGLKLEAIPTDGGGVGRADDGNFVLTSLTVTVDGNPVPIKAGGANFVQNQFSIDGLLAQDRNSGWAISPRYRDNHRLVVEFDRPITGKRVEIKMGFYSPYARYGLKTFRFTASRSPFPLTDLVDDATRALAKKESRTPEEETKLENLYAQLSREGFALRKSILESKRAYDVLNNSLPEALVLQEKPGNKKLTSPVYHRGEFLSPGEPVDAGVPSVLPPIEPNQPVNRVTFAKWLVSKGQPLTARVEVNRMWEQYFGRGLVETSDDFGTQGSTPSHPKLLDYLATQFMAKNWDMKAIHRMIVTSATYRQSSASNPALNAKDSENVFLARGPRFRMEAEMIRDTLLTASGLLDKKIGGPSVMPFQPIVWAAPYNGETWMEAKDSSRYRRGLYVFIKRTETFPSFMTMDATSREVCVARRSRTNTPLQALTLLNDKASFELAQALGKRMEQKADIAEGITMGFRLATGRRPKPAEVSILKASWEKFHQKYQKDLVSAKKLGKDEKAAAWTMVGNILLNLDETISKG